MTRYDGWTLLAYGAITGPLVSHVIAGPNLGLLGLTLSVLLSVLGWFAGTAILLSWTGSSPRPDENFRRRMWFWCACSAVMLIVSCLLYVTLVANGRTSYAGGWLVIHFTVVATTCILVRVMVLSANQALASREISEARSRRRRGPPRGTDRSAGD